MTTVGTARADQSFGSKVHIVKKFFEYAWGFQFDDAGTAAIREGLTAEFDANAVNTDNTVQKMHDLLKWVKTQSPFDQNFTRMELEPRLVASVDQDMVLPYAVRYTLLTEWLAHNATLARGDPPLTQKTVDAVIAFQKFVAKQSGTTIPASVDDPNQFSVALASQYAVAPASEQLNISLIVPLWYEVQYVWGKLTPAEQNKVRAKLRANQATATNASQVGSTSHGAGSTTDASTLSQAENFFQNVIQGPAAERAAINHDFMNHFIQFGF